MAQEPSAAARKAMRRNERKEERQLTRKQVKALGMIATAKLFLAIKAQKQAVALSEECPTCLQMQRDAA